MCTYVHLKVQSNICELSFTNSQQHNAEKIRPGKSAQKCTKVHIYEHLSDGTSPLAWASSSIFGHNQTFLNNFWTFLNTFEQTCGCENVYLGELWWSCACSFMCTLKWRHFKTSICEQVNNHWGLLADVHKCLIVWAKLSKSRSQP